ncbi:hypothetical protein O181_080982 [Austropuccinia psidii MF-1]|uniref:Uncharacterized protein n=1 Tax=Austropuccinia psidii MF-1 TaxID=1389203 RepID=A0A9Q3FMN6_9BASI|nr:hypothetical protein [Austropuccinia psidii MF-1]
MPVQAPDASHTESLRLYKFPTIQMMACAGAALQQLQHFLMRVQAPNASHANPYACAGSQQFKQLLTPGQAFGKLTSKSLPFYRFPKLHTHILTLVQVTTNSDHSLHLGSHPTVLTIPYTTKINSV